MTEEQLQKFYAIAEPRSENAIRKAEERKMKRADMNHKFFLDPGHLCYWCNHNKVEVISITFVPRGGWCVFYKENSKNKEDIELAIKTMERDHQPAQNAHRCERVAAQPSPKLATCDGLS